MDLEVFGMWAEETSDQFLYHVYTDQYVGLVNGV